MIQNSPGRDTAAFVNALRTRDPLRAGAVARAMLADGLPLGRQWQAVARFAASEGDWPLALQAMEQFVADQPTDVSRQLSFAEALAQSGRVDAAAKLLEPLARQYPARPEVHHFLGVAQVERGRHEEGVASLWRAVRLSPGAGQSWLALANAHRFAPGDELFETLAAQEAGFARAVPSERAAWLYARGKAFDDLGEHDRAFAAFAAGARLVATERRYDAQADRAAALRTIEGLSRDWLAAHAVSVPEGRSLFVTGKPRSGTTLVERILTAHSAVSDGGEVNLLAAAAAATGFDDATVCRRGRAGADPWAAFRARHRALVDGRFVTPGLAVDKSLNTSRVAALLRLAWPEAPLVWLRRDPIDTAWSSFRTFFSRGVEWSFDLVAMAQYHAIEDRLHAFWADAYGDRLLTLDYETLVEQPDATIARLLAHCGLADEPGVRDFHLADRAVQTASVGQVRSPINRAGLDSAGPYRAHLAPYEQALAEARKALGL